MGGPRSLALLPLALLAAVTVFAGCDAPNLDTDALEDQLRRDPARPGKVGQFVGLHVFHNASKASSQMSVAPEPACSLELQPGTRWIGELSFERTRAGVATARWTETRTLDLTQSGASLRLAASYLTEIGGTGTQAAEWRVVPEGTFLATPSTERDLWIRRDTEPGERDRLIGLGPGTIQSLLEAVDGWRATADGWTLGDTALRCASAGGRPGFADRFVASTTASSANLRVDEDGRQFEATWRLSDGSTLHAQFEDRVVRFEAALNPPAQVVTTAQDDSMHRAQELLEKLAADGLAEVASAAPAPAEKP